MNRRVQSFGWVLAALLLAMLALPAQAADTVVYYHTDALHSVAVVTNASGAVIERAHYAPYGQVLDRPLRDGPGYTGHQEDATTGLVYMQQRYYDPESGRFLSTDPVQADGNGGSFNRYWYANDNPYRYTDPDGRAPDTDFGLGQMAQSYGAHPVSAETAMLAASALPVVGDAVNIAVAIKDPSFSNIAIAAVGLVVPEAGAVSRALKVTAKELRAAGKADFAASKAKAFADASPECVYCGSPATQGDHVKPLKSYADAVNTGKMSKADAIKQANAPENIVPACASCNGAGQKGAKELSNAPGKGKWVPPNKMKDRQ